MSEWVPVPVKSSVNSSGLVTMLIPYLSIAKGTARFQSGSNEVPIRFQWKQGAISRPAASLYRIRTYGNFKNRFYGRTAI